jgi:hypothetical protein
MSPSAWNLREICATSFRVLGGDDSANGTPSVSPAMLRTFSSMMSASRILSCASRLVLWLASHLLLASVPYASQSHLVRSPARLNPSALRDPLQTTVSLPFAKDALRFRLLGTSECVPFRLNSSPKKGWKQQPRMRQKEQKRRC